MTPTIHFQQTGMATRNTPPDNTYDWTSKTIAEAAPFPENFPMLFYECPSPKGFLYCEDYDNIILTIVCDTQYNVIHKEAVEWEKKRI